MSEKTVERCVSCVLPVTGYTLKFDHRGQCSVCDYDRTLQSAHEGVDRARIEDEKKVRLEAAINDIRERGKGRKYDCLVGLSGGRDSTYLLYLLVKKHNLRCLAAYYRTPFTVDTIDANVRRMTKMLNVPLVEMDISASYHARLAREMMVLWQKKPYPVIANLACAPCKFVNREAFKICRQHDITSLVYGGSAYEMFQLSAGQLANVDPKKKHSLAIQALEMLTYVRRGAKLLSQCMGMWKYAWLGFKSSVLYRCPHTVFLRMRYPGIKRFEYFYNVTWDEQECLNALKEVGWELPAGCNSTWKADCSFAELKNVVFKATTGVTYMDALLSNMVRAGAITREQALQRIVTEGKYSPERAVDARRCMQVSDEFLEDVVNGTWVEKNQVIIKKMSGSPQMPDREPDASLPDTHKHTKQETWTSQATDSKQQSSH